MTEHAGAFERIEALAHEGLPDGRPWHARNPAEVFADMERLVTIQNAAAAPTAPTVVLGADEWRRLCDNYAGRNGWRVGFKLQLGGLWIGAHYSKHNRRLCINLLPCLTVWVCLPGGRVP